MAASQYSHSSSDEEDDADVTDTTNAKQRVKFLHYRLASDLNRQLNSKVPEYQNFLQLAQSYLPRGVLSLCDNIMDVFVKLENEMKIHMGYYKPLRKMLKGAGRADLSQMVKLVEQKIHMVLQTGQEGEITVKRTSSGLTSSSKNRTQSDPKLRALWEKSNLCQRMCKKNLSTFVKTKAYEETKELIHTVDSVIILAGSGDGKSYILQQISLDFADEGYMTLILTSPDEVETLYVKEQKMLFIFDDTLGGSYFIQELARQWIRKGDSYFNQFMSDGNVKFLFASRKLIWSDSQHGMTSMKLFQHRVDVSSESLSPGEKEEFLTNHFADKLPVCIRNRICQERMVSFPESCRRISQSDVDLDDGDRIYQNFANPSDSKCKQIRILYEPDEIGNSENWKYVALVLIMLNNGKLPTFRLGSATAEGIFKDMLDRVLNACSIDNRRPPLGMIRKSAEKLCGTLLTNDCECFAFYHDSVHEAVMTVYGESYPEDIVEFCAPERVVSVCRAAKFANNSDQCIVKMNRMCYSKFVQLLSHQVIKGGWYVFQNPAVQDKDVQERWIQHLKSVPEELQSYIINDEGNIFYHAAKSGAFELLMYICQHADQVCLSSCFSSVTYHPLVGLAAGGHTPYVKLFLELLPNNDGVGELQTVECSSGCPRDNAKTSHVVRLLLKHNLPIDALIQSLIEASRGGHTGIVKLLLQHNSITYDQNVGYEEVMQLLLGHDSSTHIPD